MVFMQPDARNASAAAGPDRAANGDDRSLVKEARVPTEPNGPRWVSTAPDLNLDRYVSDFNGRILAEYGRGQDARLPADAGLARSLMPPATGRLRDFSYVSPELPRFVPELCVACMECVTMCPDTAILAKLAEPEAVAACADTIGPKDERDAFLASWIRTTKFHDVFEKRGERGGLFAIHVDPAKCKGCGECVEVCGSHQALVMEPKTDSLVERYRAQTRNMRNLADPPARLLAKRLPVDAMLQERALLYVGGAGSCAGCGEATAIRMMLAATGAEYGSEEIGIVAATGCNTVYGSTYPYNPYRVTWTNSLFENAPAVAMGVRARWDQRGLARNRLWVLGGDGAMYDIGFQSLSRMLASGMDIKVLVLDTQVYSNTGGQASTSTFRSQGAKMSPFGKAIHGKTERRKELSNIALMHPDVYVAQTSTAYLSHFYQAIREANAYPGPAVVNVYTTCPPEHGVADDTSQQQARRAVNSRAFPLFIHDPRKGKALRERLSLRGNPGMTEDWSTEPKSDKPFTFVDFARTEGRFAKQFAGDGTPSPELIAAQDDRLQNWRLLQELAGQRK